MFKKKQESQNVKISVSEMLGVGVLPKVDLYKD